MEESQEIEKAKLQKLPKKPSNFFVKYSPTAISMVFSLLLYLTFIEWKFSVGLLLLTLLHEVGHMIAAKFFNIKVNVPIFVPFFGAFVTLEQMPRSTYVQSVISFGGPLAGGIGALVVLIAGYYCKNPEIKDFLLVLAWFTALINLLNLIPFIGLDGAGISMPMKFIHWVVFLILFPFLIFWYYQETSRFNPIMLLILICALVKGIVVWGKNIGLIKTSLLEKLKFQGRFPDENLVSNPQRLQSVVGYVLISMALTALIIYSEMIRGKSPWSIG